MERLVRHAWPGNVRQLKNAIEHAVIFAPGEVIRPADLPMGSERQEGAAEMPTMRELERRYIRDVLVRTRGNKLQAARVLGIPRASLYRKIQKYGIT